MAIYIKLIFKIFISTIVYGLFLFLAIFTTTLLVQGNLHPDYWKTTYYDIFAGLFVTILYLTFIVIQVGNALKYKSKN